MKKRDIMKKIVVLEVEDGWCAVYADRKLMCTTDAGMGGARRLTEIMVTSGILSPDQVAFVRPGPDLDAHIQDTGEFPAEYP